MAKSKADLEADWRAYESSMRQVRAAEASGMFRTAVDRAVEAFPRIDGMMQHLQKTEDREFDSVEAIDTVLRLSPLLLDLVPLNTLADLLKSKKRIDRVASDDLAERLAQARKQTWENHRMWNLIEEAGEFRQDELRLSLGGDQARWRSVSEAWERMGLLVRRSEGRSYVIALATRLGEVVVGKCRRCGTSEQAPKAMLLEPLRCPACREEDLFVLLGPAPR